MPGMEHTWEARWIAPEVDVCIQMRMWIHTQKKRQWKVRTGDARGERAPTMPLGRKER